MKKFSKMFTCCLLLSVLISNIAFAYNLTTGDIPPVTAESELLPLSEKISKVHVTSILKGSFFAAGDLAIRNKDGKIGVLVKTYMREPVDLVLATVYLDRYEDGGWSQVAYYDFEFESEDYPEGMLTPGVNFTIVDQPTGYYYRMRGNYIAFLNGKNEGFGPVTNGIYIQ